MLAISKAKLFIIGICLTILAVIVACGEEATPTATSTVTATPTATPTSTPTPSPAPGAGVEPTGILNVGLTDLGPVNYGIKPQSFLNVRYDPLVTHDNLWVTSPGGRTLPNLVKEWEVDSTGLVFTLKLQEGAKWNDLQGRDFGEFNADDFLFTFQEASTPGTIHVSAWKEVYMCGFVAEEEAPATPTPEPVPGEPTPFQHGARPLEDQHEAPAEPTPFQHGGGEEVEPAAEACELTKIDDYTVQLTRPEPTVQLTWNARAPLAGALPMHSKKHFDAVGREQTNLESVGTGSWIMIEAQVDQFRRVRAVRDHWRKTPEFDEMVWWDLKEESTRLANFLTGDVDTGTYSPTSIQAIRAENEPGVKFMSFSGSFEQHLNMLGAQYATDDPAHLPGPGGEEPLTPLGDNVFDCSLPYVSCDRDTESEEWDTARKVRLAMNIAIDRQKLVNNIAIGEGAPVYALHWVGHDARLRQFGLDQLVYEYDPARARQLLTEAGYPDGFELDMWLIQRPTAGAVETAEAVAVMWEDVGIRSNQFTLTTGTFRPRRVDRTAKGIQAYNVSAQAEPIRAYSLFYDAAEQFNEGLEHPWFQQKIQEAIVTVDEEARWAVQAEMARWAFDNAMFLPLYEQNEIWPISAKLDPWEPMALNLSWLSNWEFAPHRQ